MCWQTFASGLDVRPIHETEVSLSLSSLSLSLSLCLSSLSSLSLSLSLSLSIYISISPRLIGLPVPRLLLTARASESSPSRYLSHFPSRFSGSFSVDFRACPFRPPYLAASTLPNAPAALPLYTIGADAPSYIYIYILYIYIYIRNRCGRTFWTTASRGTWRWAR